MEEIILHCLICLAQANTFPSCSSHSPPRYLQGEPHLSCSLRLTEVIVLEFAVQMRPKYNFGRIEAGLMSCIQRCPNIAGEESGLKLQVFKLLGLCQGQFCSGIESSWRNTDCLPATHQLPPSGLPAVFTLSMTISALHLIHSAGFGKYRLRGLLNVLLSIPLPKKKEEIR